MTCGGTGMRDFPCDPFVGILIWGTWLDRNMELHCFPPLSLK